MSSQTEIERRLEIPGRVTFMDGNGGLRKVRIQTEWSEAEIYLHGAHVTHFQKKNEPPLLFLSEKSQYKEGVPIRGGVPIIFPWFGPKEGDVMHGFARLKTWEVAEASLDANGRMSLRLTLPDCPEAAKVTPFKAEFTVTVGEALMMKLSVENTSKDQDFVFESCLHTYFAVGDIGAVSISGLKGKTYVDKVDNFAKKVEAEQAIRVSSEVNRIYEDTGGTQVKILDEKLQRTVLVQTFDATSTVVWNPWITQSKAMTDFGDEEYKKMVCVESGNVAKNNVTLSPRRRAFLRVKLSSEKVV
jgi:D-hexose-6-phosphate mutarotase